MSHKDKGAYLLVQPHPHKACVAIKSPLWALLEWITALRIVLVRTDSRSAERTGVTLHDRAKMYVPEIKSNGRKLVR